MRFAGILVIAPLLLAACGQKGPLHLPPPTTNPNAQSTAPVTPSTSENRKPADRPFPDVPATTDK